MNLLNNTFISVADEQEWEVAMLALESCYLTYKSNQICRLIFNRENTSLLRNAS